MDPQTFTVIVGLDVGKHQHHAVATDRQGTVLVDRIVANEEPALGALLDDLEAIGAVLVVVDQPASIGALPVAIAQQRGLTVSYLPGRTMRQVAGTFPGEAKTDARDAAIIAAAARTMPHTIRALAPVDAHVADLRLLCGFDDDLGQQVTALTNRMRGLLSTVHPPLERVLGPRLADAGVLALLQRRPTPAALRTAGAGRITTLLTRHGSRRATVLAADIRAALDQQTVEVAGTGALATILPQLAGQLQLLLAQRRAIGTQIERVVVQHPLCPILRSLPGFGVRITARTLVELAGKEFVSAAHLASYAGVAPVTWQSGSSIRRQRRPRKGNKSLKNAFYQAAFAALAHPPSRAYYTRKRQEGHRHEQALLALARRRTDVLYAMIRDGTPYHVPA
jgi:transposase